MGSTATDREILDILIQQLGIQPRHTDFDSSENLVRLDLYGFDLTQIPQQIFELTNLVYLDLSCNRLTTLNPEIGQLKKLHQLKLHYNRLTALPPEIGQLTELRNLALANNQLTSLPSQVEQLRNLGQLYLGSWGMMYMPKEISISASWKKYTQYNNQFECLPPEIWTLRKLTLLDLWRNRLPFLAPEVGLLTNLTELNIGGNRLTSLPPEIGQLTNLKSLTLRGQLLRTIPHEIGRLTSLETLSLDLDTSLTTALPSELWSLPRLTRLSLVPGSFIPSDIQHLSQLQELLLSGRLLDSLPPELGRLIQLKKLRINASSLRQLPPEIGHLINLRDLGLSHNQLTQLPPEIGQLSQLEALDLRENRLRQLPPEIGNLSNLHKLDVGNNPHLLTPPPEIIQGGTQDTLAFLRELQQNSVTRHEAKLLVVGEGGTGKSSLLRALQGEQFEPHSSTTHGIEVGQISLTLRSSKTSVTLNTWDFGGQHIYHATHQFFLTRRSLYLVVWNARLGVEQGRLHYWLETIKALAPDAPVILVATHIDERAPDINYQLLKKTYSQMVGNLSISNKTDEGIGRLKENIVKQAMSLPHVGQPWPAKWLAVEQGLQGRSEHHIDANTYFRCCKECQVDKGVARGTLGDYLHDLGKILFFRDDYILSNMVVLKPNWITKAISLVLTNEKTRKDNGIIQHVDLSHIWATDEQGHPYEPHLYPIFLRLMERFDLSYQIEGDVPGVPSTRSLIPQLLPYQPPANLPPWPQSPKKGGAQVTMVYRFDFVPTGIMTWLIVRTHRYTQNLHWREGVLLAYEGHQARIELNEMQRELRLVVRGVQPHNFFTILMNTIDIILARFKGLAVRREIPCICHWERDRAKPCFHYYSYEELIRRMEARRYSVECAQTFTDVSVPMLLYGIHTSTDNQVIDDIRRGQQQIAKRLDDLQKLDSILEKLNQQSELVARNFTRQWNLEMQKLETECPGTFFLTLGSEKRINPKNWVSQEYKLYLVCQHPPGPHRVGDGYVLREAEEWWIKVNPWLNRVLTFLKFGLPIGRAIGAVYDEVALDHMKADLDLMDEITQHIPDVATFDALSTAAPEPDLNHEQRVIGPALRALHSFLKKADAACIWGGLQKTITPDGNILWLCAEHRKQYEAKPLAI